MALAHRFFNAAPSATARHDIACVIGGALIPSFDTSSPVVQFFLKNHQQNQNKKSDIISTPQSEVCTKTVLSFDLPCHGKAALVKDGESVYCPPSIDEATDSLARALRDALKTEVELIIQEQQQQQQQQQVKKPIDIQISFLGFSLGGLFLANLTPNRIDNEIASFSSSPVSSRPPKVALLACGLGPSSQMPTPPGIDILNSSLKAARAGKLSEKKRRMCEAVAFWTHPFYQAPKDNNNNDNNDNSSNSNSNNNTEEQQKTKRRPTIFNSLEKSELSQQTAERCGRYRFFVAQNDMASGVGDVYYDRAFVHRPDVPRELWPAMTVLPTMRHEEVITNKFDDCVAQELIKFLC